LIESNDGRLHSELIRILQEQQKPLNLEEIFCLLYDRRERLSELMAMTRERTLEMRRLNRSLDQSVYCGLMETSWENGQIYYSPRKSQHGLEGSSFQMSIVRERDSISFSSRPYRFQIAPNWNDKLLSTFCVIALIVLALIGVLLAFG
jgi:hypothetical protein